MPNPNTNYLEAYNEQLVGDLNRANAELDARREYDKILDEENEMWASLYADDVDEYE